MPLGVSEVHMFATVTLVPLCLFVENWPALRLGESVAMTRYPYVFSNPAVPRSFITAINGVRAVNFKAVT